MLSPVVVNIFSLLPLLFTIYLAKRNLSRAKENLYYILAASISILLLLIEIATYFLNGVLSTWAFVLHMLCYVLGFSLTPIVPLQIVFYLGYSKLSVGKKVLVTIPIYANIALSALSIQTGWFFVISTNNIYLRGPYFYFVTVVSAFYFILVGIRILSEKEDLCPAKGLLGLVYILPVVATAVQLITVEYSYIFSMVAIALLLYYVIMQECRFAYDLQTKVRNRIAFEQELHAYELTKKDVVIVMFDVNNLKQTNDTWGHQEGDAVLSSLASMINTTFAHHGKVFRVGGDEFCVMLPIQSPIGLLIKQFSEKLAVHNENSGHHPIDVAYGHAQSDSKNDISLSKAYLLADDAMYRHKAYLKNSASH